MENGYRKTIIVITIIINFFYIPISNDLYSSEFRRSVALFIEQEAIKYKNRERTKIIRATHYFTIPTNGMSLNSSSKFV